MLNSATGQGGYLFHGSWTAWIGSVLIPLGALLEVVVMPIFLFLLIVVEIIAFIGLIFGGNLSDDTLMICYAAIAVLTMPVWTGFLAMGVVGIADWFEKRHRTKRIARAKAAKLVSSG